ncbi:MAG: hypothetical protein Q4A34_01140 [Candidatus Saccharibacteria bacterium]|nr:hypothetical protein [Candidatus Saccharibacteria bacterium]
MKQAVKRLAFFMLAASVAIVPTPAVAQELVQAEHSAIDAVKAQCTSVKVTLRQLHTNDQLLRVNVGQTYNTVSAQYMARLNSRLVLKKIRSAEVVAITDRFEAQRRVFAERYNAYDSAISKLLTLDCKTQPTDFYAQLVAARDARHKLSSAVGDLNDSLTDYRVEVERLRDSLKGGA